MESPSAAREPAVPLPASAPLRCGVVGVGYLGQHHARIYAGLEGCVLAGVCDANPARAAEVAARHGAPVFADAAALAGACDVISVVVPTEHHAAVAVPLLERGCHLLIEKPLCANLDEAERILAAARAAGRLVQVGHIEHFNPVMGYLEANVSQPRFITADRLAPYQPRGTDVGVVLDLMIHDLGVILQLVNAPLVQVQGVGVRVISPTEDIANARLTFANGCVANLNTSRASAKKLREIRVFQPGAYLSFDFMNQAGHLVRVADGQIAREDVPVAKGEPLLLELQAWTDCVRRLEAPKVDGELARSALAVALEITRQIRAAG